MPAPAPLKRRVRVSERPMPTVHKGGEDRVEIIDTSSISADLSSLRSLPPPPRAGKEAPIPEERSSLDSKESKAILARIKSRPSAVSTIPLGREHLPSEPPAGARSSVAVEHDGSVEAKVEALVNMRPSEASALIREIVAAGAKRALAPLVRAFPGQLFFLRSVGPLPRPNEISSVALAIAAFGAEAEEAIADLLSHPSGDIRYYALAIAKGALTPAVAVALTALLRDEDRELRRQALELLRSISAGDPARAHAADALVHKASDPSANSDERALSLDALGILGAIEVSERLALYLEDTDATIAGSARGALITIFADDRGPSRAAWQALLDARAHKHRIEFLIEGLLHENETIRREAGAELQRLSREYLGYHAGLPRRERELLKRRYEEWWEERGRARFLGHGGV